MDQTTDSDRETFHSLTFPFQVGYVLSLDRACKSRMTRHLIMPLLFELYSDVCTFVKPAQAS